MSETREPIVFVQDEGGAYVEGSYSGAVVVNACGEPRYRRLPPGWVEEAVERIVALARSRGGDYRTLGQATRDEIRAAILGAEPEPEPEAWEVEAAKDWYSPAHPSKLTAEENAADLARHFASARRKSVRRLRHHADTEYEEATIDGIEPGKDGSFVVKHDGWCLLVQNKSGLPLPVPGETMRMYGKGTGYPVRGVVVGDRVYSYETSAEQTARFKSEQEKQDAEKRAKWEAAWPETRKRIAALPEPLKARMDFFLSREGWGWQFGGYELFCCEEAARMAETFKTAEAVREFGKADYAEQARRFKASDGHSGNTFGASVRLAWRLLAHPETLPQEHGALCPLVGCQDYGCYAVRR